MRSLAFFGALLVLLFAGIALAEGIDQPSVPAGSIAIVTAVPRERGRVSEADYDRAFERSLAQAGLESTPKHGSKKYAELKRSALATIFQGIWVRGEAAEMGISVTDKQVTQRLTEIKKQSFSSPGSYKSFLKTYHYTAAEVEESVEAELLSEEIERPITAEVEPSEAQIEEDYEASKASQFTKAATRDVRFVYNKSKAKVLEARAELIENDTAPSWAEVARHYSTSTLKQNGGLQTGLTRESIEEPLGAKLFQAHRGVLKGPLKVSGGYLLFEVEKETPAKVQSLAEVRSQIKSSLTKTLQEEALSDFSSSYSVKWISRTTCTAPYTTEYCSNYAGSSRPSEAPAACYEANPKGGQPSSCPAPVQQTAPAMPGSVTPLRPKGEQRPQRPQPGQTGTAPSRSSAGGQRKR